MKRALPVLLILLLLCKTLHATHIIGGELRYEYTGTNYRIELSIYQECYAGASTATGNTLYVFVRSGCGTQALKTLTRYRIDTVREMYCPATNATCGSTTYPVYLVNHYSDTISMPVCSNDTISYSTGVWGSNILNLSQTLPWDQMYLEAYLNNTSGPNSAAYIQNHPPFVTPVSTLVSTPTYSTDADGDAVTTQVITPQGNLGNAGMNYTYVTGYSVSQPFGGGSSAYLSASGNQLATYVPAIGKFVMAMRTSDYRNNQLVGYSTRCWMLTSTTLFTNPKAPVPASGTVFTATTCPGQASGVTLNFVDSVATDSVFLAFMPTNNFTYTTSYSPGIGVASATIGWTTPATLNPATTPYFTIKVLAHDNACPVQGFAWYNILVHTGLCSTDSVWPGDANADHIVDMYDPLAVALAYSQTGPARAAATTAWNAQFCTPWSATFLNNINTKHADCDGSGTVNNTDLTAITANYGLTHPRETYQQLARVTGLPDLYFDHTGLSFYPGASVSLPVKMGTAAAPMNNIYGLAASVKVSGITPGNASISYPVSWLGTAAGTVRFSKNVTPNVIDWAYAGNNRLNRSGSGALAALGFTIPASTPAGQKVVFTFEHVKVIDTAGNVITSFNTLSDTVTIKPSGIEPANILMSGAVVIPNPSREASVLQFFLQERAEVRVNVTDISGRTVWQQDAPAGAGTGQAVLPIGLKAGIYMIRITANSLQYPEVLKWIIE